jgi:DNA-binding FrmR family transcriptional regulator
MEEKKLSCCENRESDVNCCKNREKENLEKQTDCCKIQTEEQRGCGERQSEESGAGCCERQSEAQSEERTCCCEKMTMRSEDEYKKLINRLNRIEGQIRGIKGMLERNAYCTDILVQSAAVNAAVNSFNKELLASHIRNCVARDIRDGKDEVIDELVAALQKLMK